MQVTAWSAELVADPSSHLLVSRLERIFTRVGTPYRGRGR